MDKTVESFLIDRGHEKDDNADFLKNFFSKQENLKRFNVSVKDNFFGMLFARMDENNVQCRYDGNEDRLIATKEHNIIMNIVKNNIYDCIFKKYGSDKFEFDFKIKNIWFSIYIVV